MNGVASKLALVTGAAVALYVPSLGVPMLDSCTQSIGVAGAAPSPSCGGDLRECLRLSADMHPTTFGVRYVTAEDVARCMEAFNSCISGGARRGGVAKPPVTTTTRAGSADLPERFTVNIKGVVDDCRRDGDSVTCTTTLSPMPSGFDTYKGTVSGTLSGRTLTGTRTFKDSGHQETDPSCRWEMEGTDPVTLRFNPDGTVAMKQGPGRVRESASGSCNGTGEFDSGVAEATGTWSASG